MRNRNGFSLIELLAAIVILGLILAIAVPAISGNLGNFRIEYYYKLEKSVLSAGEEYISDKRFSKPTELLYSYVVPISKLENEGYIDEVVDYSKSACDKDNSYVIVVKTSDNNYEYAACLKCDSDGYETITSEQYVNNINDLKDSNKEVKDFCNAIWRSNEEETFTYGGSSGDKLYVYYAADKNTLNQQVVLTSGIAKLKEIGGSETLLSAGDLTEVYPENTDELNEDNINNVVNLKYVFSSDNEQIREALVYDVGAPKVEFKYTKANEYASPVVPVGTVYSYGSNEWAGGLSGTITFNDSDNAEIKDKAKIKKIEYYDSATNKWVDLGCSNSSTCTCNADYSVCTWNIDTNFNKNIKLRYVHELNGISVRSKETDYLSIKVGLEAPSCGTNTGVMEWTNSSRTVSVECVGDLCVETTYSETYPTASVKNKKIAKINIYDKAGNSTTCDVNVYVDTTKPSACTLTMKNTSNTTITAGMVSATDVTFSVSGVDNETDASGIDITKALINGTPSCTDKAGNTMTGNAVTFTLKKTAYITFDSNGGSGSMTKQTCTNGNECTINTNAFTREGYTFNGWKDSNGNSYSDGGKITLNGDVTLYAQWKGNTYKVSFNGNGNSGGSTSTVTCTYGSNCTLSANGFTKTGYSFAGWATSASGSVVYADQASVKNLATSGTVTLYAKWMANTYKIKFSGNGSTSGSMSNLTCTYDSNCTLTANVFSKTGYSFAGWSTSASGSVAYDDQASVKNLAASGTITLYAKWTANTYKVNFNGNGSTSGSMSNKTCTYDSNCTLTANAFSKTGYKFSGWATSTSGSVKYANKASVKNLATSGTYKLYAVWEISYKYYYYSSYGAYCWNFACSYMGSCWNYSNGDLYLCKTADNSSCVVANATSCTMIGTGTSNYKYFRVQEGKYSVS